MDQASNPHLPHLRRQGTATQLIVDGEPFVMLSGEVHNSSGSSLAYMEPIWDRLVALGLNSAVVPTYWELVEPEEGRFDFALVGGLIEAARARGLRLCLLWFGTWKNAESHYAPEWVKTDLARFPRAHVGNRATITALSAEAREADARAFAALMKHIRETDGRRHTVIAMQIENETGVLGAPRDRCPLAEEAFAEDVPAALIDYLGAHRDALLPETAAVWQAAGSKTSGTWTEVFGAAADEVFMAWHTARFVDRVTEAGKAEHPIPMYANAWLVAHEGQRPGDYPSGGPVAGMMDVWRAGAPHVDWLAPDIYRPDFAAVCREYARSGNPLMIPETHRDQRAAANVFYAVGAHDAICFAPFAIDSVVLPHPLADSYRVLAGMMPLITRHHGTGRMAGLVQEGPAMAQEFDLGGYHLRAEYARPLEKGRVPGCGLVVAVSDDEYYVAGSGLTLKFSARPGGPANVGFLSLDEGRFDAGAWVPGRRLNGDESYLGVVLGAEPCVRRARLYSYD